VRGDDRFGSALSATESGNAALRIKEDQETRSPNVQGRPGIGTCKGRRSRVLEFLNPHFELFGVGTLKETRHVGGKARARFPDASDLLREGDGRVVGLT
jgi:hypothetical protein